jgi:phosphoenolpyruvate carboxykinase (ATP)
VPQEVLNPELSWSDQGAYKEEAVQLAQKFAENFIKYADSVSPEVVEAGPRIQ